jgi:perosamine synthetase
LRLRYLGLREQSSPTVILDFESSIERHSPRRHILCSRFTGFEQEEGSTSDNHRKRQAPEVPRIPIRIPMSVPDLSGNESSYVNEALATGWISSKGRFVTEFEQRYAKWIGTRFASCVANGTAGLHVALAALGIGSGDEVVIPTFTMIACANAVRYLGATPVLADSDRENWNIDPERVREAITPKTKAIMIVHLYGHPANVQPILDIAREAEVNVIEDAAEAIGAEYHGRRVGGLCDLGVFSLYANKILTTGEGGVITTDNPTLAARVNSLRDQAYDESRREWLVHREIGYNYRLTNLQAAVGLAQLERVQHFLQVHRSLGERYRRRLSGLRGIELPPGETDTRDVYWTFTILDDQRSSGVARDDLMRFLRSQGIDSRSTFLPIHRQPPYSKSWTAKKFPVADELSDRGVNLPLGNTTSIADVDEVCDAVETASRTMEKS